MQQYNLILTKFEELEQVLKGFRESSLITLQDIFEKGAHPEASVSEDELKSELLAVLQLEMSCHGFKIWEINDGNHLLLDSDHCMLINLRGVRILYSSALFFEGELMLRNIRWMPNDRLVQFDLYNIVHEEVQKCVCHYSGDDEEFVLLSQIEEDTPRGKYVQTLSEEDDLWDGGW